MRPWGAQLQKRDSDGVLPIGRASHIGVSPHIAVRETAGGTAVEPPIDGKSSEFFHHPAPPVKIRVDSGYLKSRARVTVPGFRMARRVASLR